jgi:hypothetical protein
MIFTGPPRPHERGPSTRPSRTRNPDASAVRVAGFRVRPQLSAQGAARRGRPGMTSNSVSPSPPARGPERSAAVVPENHTNPRLRDADRQRFLHTAEVAGTAPAIRIPRKSATSRDPWSRAFGNNRQNGTRTTLFFEIPAAPERRIVVPAAPFQNLNETCKLPPIPLVLPVMPCRLRSMKALAYFRVTPNSAMPLLPFRLGVSMP